MPRVVIEIQVVNKACFLKCLHFCYTPLHSYIYSEATLRSQSKLHLIIKHFKLILFSLGPIKSVALFFAEFSHLTLTTS